LVKNNLLKINNIENFIMIPKGIKTNIKKDDVKISKIKNSSFIQPKFNPATYCKQLQISRYYYALITLRHYIKAVSDFYFSSILGAKNVDLFMMTNSVSSPIGPGSDSEPIRIKFGKLYTYLVDSSQFGFEPLLSEKMNKVYCYLPSMRGENPDNRHLNQFFHCEMEIIGTLNDLMPMIENYVKILCETVLAMPHIVERISDNPKRTNLVLRSIVNAKKFPVITLDKAIELLTETKGDKKKFVKISKNGRSITTKGEIELLKILRAETPVWLTQFDRDTVPFYQKPLAGNKKKTINADLIFSSLISNSFGGEIVGSGQRQNTPKEMYESLRRQGINSKNYEWYINIRRSNKYKTTSGFGLGVERFISWALAKENISDVALYPRLKNVKMYP